MSGETRDIHPEMFSNLLLFREIAKMIEKYEMTSSLVSADIENMMTEVLSEKPDQIEDQRNLKRKLEPTPSSQPASKSRPTKRLKSSSTAIIEDKENPQSDRILSLRPTRSRLDRATPLKTLDKNTPLSFSQQPLVAKPINQRLLNELSFANLQFEHEYRISDKCIARMISYYFGVSFESLGGSQSLEVNIDLSTLAKINSLATNERFVEFLTKVVETKLKNLTSSLNQSTQQPSIKIFQLLSILWT